MATLNKKLANSLSQHMYSNSQLAYLVVDEHLKICELSPNCHAYLGENPKVGERVDEVVDCMVGLDFSQTVRWPIIESSHGAAMTLNTLHIDNHLYILITDASEAIAQRQTLQQAANQNELLVNEKQKLLQSLERKTQALEQASRLQTAFLAGVAHEFRTPLVSILGYGELVDQALKTQSRENPSLNGTSVDTPIVSRSQSEVRQWVRAIQRSGRHLLSLIENLLDHGKSQSEQLQLNLSPVNLKVLLEDMQLLVSSQAKQKGLKFVTTLNGSQILEDYWVTADADRLTQCLINVTGNAIKFTDQGSVTLSAAHDGRMLSFSVVDTGIGMSESELLMVREPFWQADHQQRPGTGLGVTITNSIIDLMGGELCIESEHGVGTEVTVHLPVDSTVYTEQLYSQTIDQAPLDYRLLMVEDDDDIALMLEYLLSERGFVVSRAAEGGAAMKLLQQQEADFDLVLMDVVLPFEDGFSVAQKFRDTGCDTPIVMMSASEQEFASRDPKQIKYDGYLLKPVAVNDLVVLARELVQAHSEH